VGAFATVIITGVYTVFGGMRAIMSTATPQAVIILVGSAVITTIGLSKLGGWGELVNMAKSNADNSLERPWLPVARCADRFAYRRYLVLVH
jgi:SSS family solute:Na+ symporter